MCDILKQLPVKDLVRFKCVSKGWFGLINDPYFIRLHLNESMETTNINVILKERTSGKLFSFVGFDDYINLDDPRELNHPFTLRLSEGRVDCNEIYDYTEVMGSCNGLLCLVNETYRTKTIVLWNMSTGDYKVLPDLPVVPRLQPPCETFYGFGYDSIADDYKVVRIVQQEANVSSEVKVYSLKANTWRCSEEIPNNYYIPYPYSWKRGGAFLCGALHWVVIKREDFSCWVIAFDIGSEKYHEIELLDYMLDTTSYADTTLETVALGVLGGCVCILLYSYASYDKLWQLWLMKDYGVKESWTLLFSVVQDIFSDPPLILPLAYSKTRDKIMLTSYWCDIEGDE